MFSNRNNVGVLFLELWESVGIELGSAYGKCLSLWFYGMRCQKVIVVLKINDGNKRIVCVCVVSPDGFCLFYKCLRTKILQCKKKGSACSEISSGAVCSIGCWSFTSFFNYIPMTCFVASYSLYSSTFFKFFYSSLCSTKTYL